jgi:hypothetical protein
VVGDAGWEEEELARLEEAVAYGTRHGCNDGFASLGL